MMHFLGLKELCEWHAILKLVKSCKLSVTSLISPQNKTEPHSSSLQWNVYSYFVSSRTQIESSFFGNTRVSLVVMGEGVGDEPLLLVNP